MKPDLQILEKQSFIIGRNFGNKFLAGLESSGDRGMCVRVRDGWVLIEDSSALKWDGMDKKKCCCLEGIEKRNPGL